MLLTGYDVNGDSYTLTYKGATSVPIVRGQNNTPAGIAAALVGGNESQQVTLGSFNAATQSFQVAVGATTSPIVFGLGGQAVSAANLQAAIQAITGARHGTRHRRDQHRLHGHVRRHRGQHRRRAAVDRQLHPHVHLRGARERQGQPGAGDLAGGRDRHGRPGHRRGLQPALRRHAGRRSTSTPSSVTDADRRRRHRRGDDQGHGRDPRARAGPRPSPASAAERSTTPASRSRSPARSRDSTSPSLVLDRHRRHRVRGRDRPRRRRRTTTGFIIIDTGNHAPDVIAPAAYTIPPRTPFALDRQRHRPGRRPRDLHVGAERPRRRAARHRRSLEPGQDQRPAVPPVRRRASTSRRRDTLKYHSPGENAVNTNPTRVFPDMEQILANNTNAATGHLPDAAGRAARRCRSRPGSASRSSCRRI